MKLFHKQIKPCKLVVQFLFQFVMLVFGIQSLLLDRILIAKRLILFSKM